MTGWTRSHSTNLPSSSPRTSASPHRRRFIAEGPRLMVLHVSLASVILTVALAVGVRHSPVGERSEPDKSMRNRITVRIGDKAFAATLSDNATALAFRRLLPLSLTMTELNGNEKFARLS